MTNKLKYFVGNWKMFGDFSSFKIVNKISNYFMQSKNINNIKVILCVPNTLIYFFKQKMKSSSISLGAQNCHHYQDYGPFTGNVSAKMIKNSGASYIILGHSENRVAGETNKLIKMKIDSALKNNLTVILCIGETLKEKKSKNTFKVLKKQIANCLNKKQNLSKIIIAYEPVWSIGTNKILEPKELKKVIEYIKFQYSKTFNTKKQPLVLYGGSVNEKNIKFFSSINEIDGFLIGGASQSSIKFIDIIKNYYK
jgi:triosephosphate isomerase (TIM)